MQRQQLDAYAQCAASSGVALTAISMELHRAGSLLEQAEEPSLGRVLKNCAVTVAYVNRKLREKKTLTGRTGKWRTLKYRPKAKRTQGLRTRSRRRTSSI